MSKEKARQAIERNRQELARRREAGELDPADFDLNFLYLLQQADQPLTRNELGRKALVIT